MTGRERVARVRASLAAAAAGWAVAMAATLPMELFKVWTEARWTESVAGTKSPAGTDSFRGWGLLLRSLGEGAGIWFGWSLAIVFGAWLLGALPAIALVREDWLLRHKWLVILLSSALAELVVLTKFHFWMWFRPLYYFDPRLFTAYSLLLAVFAATMAGVYLRLVARIDPNRPQTRPASES